MSSFSNFSTFARYNNSYKAWYNHHAKLLVRNLSRLQAPRRHDPSRSLPSFRGMSSTTTNHGENESHKVDKTVMAITRQIPRDAIQEAQSSAETFDISVDLACQQHADYVSTLQKYCEEVMVLPALEDHPDCCFVEDTAVVVGNSAVVTHMGHPSRRGEVETIQAVLQDLGYQVFDMRQLDHDNDNNAICDGGDVLCTGRHVFVGLSERTNQQGAECLNQVFPNVIPVPFPGTSILHLKSAVTHIDSHTLVVAECFAKEVEDALQPQQHGYQLVTLPDARSANVLRINECVLATQTSCTDTQQILQTLVNDRNLKLEWMDTSEIAKIDGALTCGSLLLTHKSV